jgi:predicted nucleic acid-binding Zn ribbon protein
VTGKRPVDALPTLLGPELTGAACKGRGPLWDENLDPQEPAVVREDRHRAAIDICRVACPIRVECLATRTAEPSLGGGIYGGQLFATTPVPGRRCDCGTPLPDDAPTYRKHCGQACADSRRDRRRLKAETRIVTCACGTVFTTNLSHQRFCTTPCRRAHEYVRSPNPASTGLTHCQNCGDPLPKGARRRNCSTACRKKAGTTRATATRRELAREQQEAAA